MDATQTARAEQLAREMATSTGTSDELNALMQAVTISALGRMLDAGLDHHLATISPTPGPATAIAAGR